MSDRKLLDQFSEWFHAPLSFFNCRGACRKKIVAFEVAGSLLLLIAVASIVFTKVWWGELSYAAAATYIVAIFISLFSGLFLLTRKDKSASRALGGAPPSVRRRGR